MNATARTARQIIRNRTATAHAKARVARKGLATLATYATAAGLNRKEAASVAGSLRSSAKKLGITGAAGVAFRKGMRRVCRRFTPSQIHTVAVAYKPRKAAYLAARNSLISI